jgi:fused signal recognition particle receptor
MTDTGLITRLRSRLNRGDSWLTRDVGELFSAPRVLDAALIDELEERLITGDVGVRASAAISNRIRLRATRDALDAGAVRDLLVRELVTELKPVAHPLRIDASKRPFVVLVVGVNGAGKTTTIAKLAERLRAEGKSVLLAAGDTFRAAAVEQLETWAARLGIPVIAQADGADPAAVAYDALAAARARGVDVLIADTAGRLHTQGGLMDELKKVKRVLAKLDPEAPHEVLLVLDGTAGQNAVRQAREFRDALGVTGIVVTKLDGTARGGVLVALAAELGLPIRAIGIGESSADLIDFDPDAFAAALVGQRDAA